MTAAAFFGDSTLIPNGHYILPGGVILNWGFSSVQDDGYQIVTFHKPFVSAVFMAGATPRANGPIGAGNALGAHVGTVTLNTMGVGASMYAGFAIAGVYWWALGK
ncbi:MAG TPA: hypothetical protein VLZ54_11905 [Arenibacter sp.]|nr:hypothetical protein [Arenibacter sp.]